MFNFYPITFMPFILSRSILDTCYVSVFNEFTFQDNISSSFCWSNLVYFSSVAISPTFLEKLSPNSSFSISWSLCHSSESRSVFFNPIPTDGTRNPLPFTIRICFTYSIHSHRFSSSEGNFLSYHIQLSFLFQFVVTVNIFVLRSILEVPIGYTSCYRYLIRSSNCFTSPVSQQFIVLEVSDIATSLSIMQDNVTRHIQINRTDEVNHKTML